MKKILFVFLFILCTYVHTEVVFADTYIVQLPELPEYDTSTFPYYYIKQWDTSRYNLYLLEGYGVTQDSDGYYFNDWWVTYSYTVDANNESNTWTNLSTYYKGNSHNTFICDLEYNQSADGTIIYSNFDIYYNDILLLGKNELNTDGFEEVDDTPTLSGIGEFFTNLGNKLANWFSNLISSISDLGSNIVNKLSDVISSITSKLSDVIASIVDLPNLLISGLQELLEFLFVPSDNLFSDFEYLFNEKFSIFNELEEFINHIKNESLYSGTPKFTITYKGSTYNIIDFSMFDDYRSLIIGISGFIMIFTTVLWILKNAPNIVNGSGVGSDEVSNV